MSNIKNEKKFDFKFSAIEPYIEENIIKNVQKEIKGQEFVIYGDKNIYPQYLHDLVSNVSVLRSIIFGIADYVGGENITINSPQFEIMVNDKGETIEDITKQIAIDICTYGGFALNILRNKLGGIAAIYNVDFRNIRSNKKNTKFFYSEDWTKSYGRLKTTVYPRFDINGKEASSIFYYKSEKYNTYPSPVWVGSVTSAECLKHISDFHLNSLYNGLASDYIVNFNAGIATDELKQEVVDNFNEKFSGFNNGARTMLSFNPDFQHRTTIEAIPQNNFIDRYNSLYQTCLKDIFTAFRVHPSIFGLPTDNSGFNSQDLAEAFKLTNTTIILPLQKTIKRCFEQIFNEKDIITIKPLIIVFNENENISSDSTEKNIK